MKLNVEISDVEMADDLLPEIEPTDAELLEELELEGKLHTPVDSGDIKPRRDENTFADGQTFAIFCRHCGWGFNLLSAKIDGDGNVKCTKCGRSN